MTATATQTLSANIILAGRNGGRHSQKTSRKKKTESISSNLWLSVPCISHIGARLQHARLAISWLSPLAAGICTRRCARKNGAKGLCERSQNRSSLLRGPTSQQTGPREVPKIRCRHVGNHRLEANVEACGAGRPKLTRGGPTSREEDLLMARRWAHIIWLCGHQIMRVPASIRD